MYSGTQTLDLYTPARKGFATVVYTDRGGWHSGSGKSSKPIAEMLQSMGYGCALVSHRLTPPHVFPAHAEDVAAAVRWVRSNIGARAGDARAFAAKPGDRAQVFVAPLVLLLGI